MQCAINHRRSASTAGRQGVVTNKENKRIKVTRVLVRSLDLPILRDTLCPSISRSVPVTSSLSKRPLRHVIQLEARKTPASKAEEGGKAKCGMMMVLPLLLSSRLKIQTGSTTLVLHLSTLHEAIRYAVLCS